VVVRIFVMGEACIFCAEVDSRGSGIRPDVSKAIG
jgi:hypothetical protein